MHWTDGLRHRNKTGPGGTPEDQTMNDVTRRRALGASAGASLAGLAAGSAAASSPAGKRGPTTDIERFDLSPVTAGVPRISYAVAHGGVVHLAGITANLNAPNDVAVQTKQ